jgi:hypothetical protein
LFESHKVDFWIYFYISKRNSQYITLEKKHLRNKKINKNRKQNKFLLFNTPNKKKTSYRRKTKSIKFIINKATEPKMKLNL